MLQTFFQDTTHLNLSVVHWQIKLSGHGLAQKTVHIGVKTQALRAK